MDCIPGVAADSILRGGRTRRNGAVQLSAKGSQIRAVEEQTEKAQFEYAEAGRRSEALKQSLAVYLEAAAKPARDAFDAAQKKFDDLTVVERSLRDQYGVQNREYVNRLDQMADAFKKFLAANEEAELRRGVAEYAKTPYLYQSSTANNEWDATLLEKHRADAKEAYELAQSALDDVQSRMKDAAFAVQTQDRLELFASIAGKLQAGTTFAPLSADDSSRLADLRERQMNKHETLSAAEKTELDGLTERDLAERYADVFTARSEHILHTMRVVRLHKAQEIIKGEIEKRRAIAESQRQNFERVLAGAFPVNDSGKEARNAVYQRLAGIVEASGAFSAPALYNEYKSYFWSGQSWMQSFGGTYINASVQNLFPVKTPTVTISQQVEAAAGVLGAAMMPVEDQKAMAQYVAANGQLLDFAGFSGVYYSFLQALGAYDTANLTDKITKAVYIPAQYTGYAMTYAGTQMMAAGAAMLILGTPLIARGAAMVAAGGAMVRTATQMLVKSQMQLNFAQITAISMQKLALDSAGDTNIRKTMAAQQEYEKAQASLDYFTKIGDVETLKHRLIAFGSLRKDDDSTSALYTLTEDDLKYLVENGAAVDSTGAAITLTAQESSDALDGRTLQNDTEFRDSFGRRYSLTKPEITSPPGALSGGLYRGSDGDYVRVRRVNDAGAEYFAYAKLESGTGTQKTYDAGRGLDALTTQGDQLRAERKAAYIAAEDAAGSQSGDGTFALRERDSTYDMLFQAATGDAAGGREYSGYRITYADVAENADLVYRDQLNQRLNIQLQDWDIRAQQLNDQKADWEDRVSTIISRGKDSWNLAENRFAAEQRKWESEQRIAEEEGKKHWEEKTKEILAKKLAFEEEMAVKKAQADANTNLSSIIDTLNAEISQFSQNTGIKKDTINKAEVLARIVDEIKSSVPIGANKLAELNSEVAKFNTRLEITELANSGNTQFDSKLASALADYDAELSDHAKNLRVLANVKVYQEYLALRNNIRQQIMDQNDSIDLQTQSAAAAAGFARSGASYIKRSAGGSVARIDAYVKLDADKAIRNAFGATGYEEMSDQSVTSLLKNANETEVEAFFYTQKLRLQAASEQIFGNGSQEARRGSRDAKIIGSLGKWIGAAPDSATGGLATRAAGDSYADDAKTRNIFTQYVATGGFGELGEYGSRPSGIAFGFYVQLQYLGEQLDQQDATAMEEKVKKEANASAARDIRNITMGASALDSLPRVYESYMAQNGTSYTQNIFANTVQRAGERLTNSFIFTDPRLLNSVLDSPVGTFFNSLNPGLAAANSTFAVRTGEGNEGYLWQAQALDVLKNVLGAFDQGLISSAIHVDTHTGEREFKYTNQDKNRIAYVALGPVGSYLASQEEWSEDGQNKLGYLDGRENDANLIRSIIHTIPMFGAVYGDVTSEYIIRQTQGTQYSNYERLNNPTLGSVAGKAATAAVIAFSVKSAAAKGQAPGSSLQVLLDGKGSMVDRILQVTGEIGRDAIENSLIKKIADDLNLFDQKQRAGGALQALGALGRREDEGLEPELGRVARLGDPRDPALFQHVNAKLLGLVGKSFFDADGLEYEYRLEDGIVVTRYTGRGRTTITSGPASVAQQSVNAEIAQAAPDGSILRFLQDQGIVGLFPNRPYSMADYNNTLQGHKAGFDGSHGFSIYQGAKQGAINLGRLLTWKPPHIPDNPVHDFLVESLDRAQDILNLQNRTRLFEDIRANPRFADPYYARAYLDGWEGNLEGGTIIAEQGMAAVPPGILARSLRTLGRFGGFARGLLRGSQAAVLEGRLIPGQLGVVEGGNPTVLGKNMMEGMGLPRGTSWTQGGYRSHHLIPSEMAEHPVIQKIGMNMDHASNGVFLPQRGGTDVRLLSRHTGDHSIYNEAVRTMLDGMDVAAPAAKLEQQVFQLQQRLNTLTRNGLPMYIKEGGSLDLWLKYLRKP